MTKPPKHPYQMLGRQKFESEYETHCRWKPKSCCGLQIQHLCTAPLERHLLQQEQRGHRCKHACDHLRVLVPIRPMYCPVESHRVQHLLVPVAFATEPQIAPKANVRILYIYLPALFHLLRVRGRGVSCVGGTSISVYINKMFSSSVEPARPRPRPLPAYSHTESRNEGREQPRPVLMFQCLGYVSLTSMPIDAGC